MRRFVLDRIEDPTDVSGTGLVAEGVEFPDGIVVLRWVGAHASTVIHDSMENLIAIHGHRGSTRVIYIDGI